MQETGQCQKASSRKGIGNRDGGGTLLPPRAVQSGLQALGRGRIEDPSLQGRAKVRIFVQYWVCN